MQAHLDSTGPEIWNQTEGKIDGFIVAPGTNHRKCMIHVNFQD